MVKPINIPWKTIKGKWDLSGVATDCSLLGWHSMSLGKLFLIIVPPSSRVKMTVPVLWNAGNHFQHSAKCQKTSTLNPWEVPNFILSNLWTGCQKNLSMLSCCLVCSITHCYGNTQVNINPRLQQKHSLLYGTNHCSPKSPDGYVFCMV
jgi:hypothetical protein